MKKIFLSSLVFIFITNLTYAQTLNVDFKWMLKHRCNNTSPELKIENIPKGTVELRIDMVDRDRRDNIHGGGVIKNEAGFPSSFTAAEGALQHRYRGPCPIGVHDYEIFVVAIDKQNNKIGEASKIRTCCAALIKE